MFYGVKEIDSLRDIKYKTYHFHMSDEYGENVCFENLLEDVYYQREVGERIYILYTPNLHTGKIDMQAVNTRLIRCNSEKLAHAISLEHYRRMWGDFNRFFPKECLHSLKHESATAREGVVRIADIYEALRRFDGVKPATSSLVHIMTSIYTKSNDFPKNDWLDSFIEEYRIQKNSLPIFSKNTKEYEIYKKRFLDAIKYACNKAHQKSVDEGVLEFEFKRDSAFESEIAAAFDDITLSRWEMKRCSFTPYVRKKLIRQFYISYIHYLQRRWNKWWNKIALDTANPIERLEAGMGINAEINISMDEYCPNCYAEGDHTRFSVPIYTNENGKIVFSSCLIVPGYVCSECGILYAQRNILANTIDRAFVRKRANHTIFGYAQSSEARHATRSTEYLGAPVLKEKLFVDICGTQYKSVEIFKNDIHTDKLTNTSFLREMGYRVDVEERKRRQILTLAVSRYGKRAVIDLLRFLVDTRSGARKDYSSAISIWRDDIDYALNEMD